VLDLEGVACHRGSVLGNLPQTPQPAQKLFDTMVWDRLRGFDPEREIYVEAESRKIGQLQVPDALLASMRASPCVQIEAALAERVDFLLQEYGHFLGDPEDLKAKLACLAGLQSKDTIARWTQQIEAEQWSELVTDLLQNHYDPAYRRATLKNFERLAQARILRPQKLDPESLEAIAAQLISGQTT
jgi:tRNA 2-selenouridine synthase